MKQRSSGAFCIEEDAGHQEGLSQAKIKRGAEVVPLRFGRNFVPQSSAHRSRLWEAPSHGAYPHLPPLGVQSNNRGKSQLSKLLSKLRI